MRKFIAGFLGVASLFAASTVFAVGTPTVRFHQIEVGTLNLGTPTASTIAKVPVMTDNVGSKMDSGSSNISNGSVTVTTSLTACDRVFLQQVAFGSMSVNWLATTSGANFTAQGYYGTESTAYVGTATIHWLAIDE